MLKKYEQPTVTLTMNLYRTVGEANPYVRFKYLSQTICKHTRGQVSGSMNADTINTETGKN